MSAIDCGSWTPVRSATPSTVRRNMVAFELDTDQVVYKHKFNESTYVCTSLFLTPVVDVRPASPNDCTNTYVYVADGTGFALVVLDVAKHKAWRITHRLFYPFPSKGTITVNCESYDSSDGVLGLALSPWHRGKDRYLYFHALASTTENVVPTRVIRNGSFILNPAADSRAINVFPKERPSQAAAQAMDRDGILYFGLMDPPSIWCWNSANDFSEKNFHRIAIDRETLQFASGVKVISNLKGEQELWVLTCRYQRYETKSPSFDMINYRIHTKKIITDSPCGLKTPYN